MNPQDNIEKLIKDLALPANSAADEHILNDALAAYEKSETKPSANPPEIWRMIMNKPITKIATVAAVLLIVASAFTILDHMAKPAYAIEQTIEAMKKFNGINLSGTMVMARKSLEEGFNSEIVDAIFKDGQIPFEIWAQVNDQGTRSGNIKIEGANGMIGVADENETQIYIPQNNTIYVQEGMHIMISPWPSYDFLTEKQKESEDWRVLYGKDGETGRDRIFVTCCSKKKSRSWWFEFDSETKLLVCFKQWANENHHGDPEYDIKKIIYYEELPDEMFELGAPENAEIFEGFSPFISGFDKLNDAQYGISVEGLTVQEASREILEQFWQATINDDLSHIRQLLPVTAEWDDELLICNLGLNDEDDIVELLEIGDISHETSSALGTVVVVPSIIKCKDGKTREVKMIIQFRQIDGLSSCVLYANSGKAREID